MLFRLPHLINAAGIHSDAAIVALQARHLLAGEWSPFLWGVGYQGSFDAMALAAAFFPFGDGPRVTMAVPLVGHLLVVLCALLILTRRLGLARATLCTLLLVFTPWALNGVILYPPRQWSITAVFLAVLILDGVQESRTPRARLLLGAVLAGAALYLDTFVLLLLPSLLIFALAVAPWAGRRRDAVIGAGLVFLGAGSSLAILLAVRRAAGVTNVAETGLTLRDASVRLQLLVNDCLPSTLGTRVFVSGAGLMPDVWDAPPGVGVLQHVGALSFVLALAVSALLVFRMRKVAPEVSKLGLLGVLVTGSTLAGFLLSPRPEDLWAARYLAPLVWFAPFAIAPLALRLNPRGLAVLLLPWVATAAIGGWVSQSPYVQSFVPVVTARGQAANERELGRFLVAEGAEAAAAQYWLAYRLSYLWAEAVPVMPLALEDDRYPPYRERFKNAGTVAYLFHPSEPRATAEQVTAELTAAATAFTRHEVSGFTVLLVRRPGRR